MVSLGHRELPTIFGMLLPPTWGWWSDTLVALSTWHIYASQNYVIINTCNPRSQMNMAYHYQTNHLRITRRHNGRDCVSNHQPRHCLLNRLFRRKSKKTSKLRVTGPCVGNSPVTAEFPTQRPVKRKMFPFNDIVMVRYEKIWRFHQECDHLHTASSAVSVTI